MLLGGRALPRHTGVTYAQCTLVTQVKVIISYDTRTHTREGGGEGSGLYMQLRRGVATEFRRCVHFLIERVL